MKVAEGIYRVDGVFGNVYLVETEEGLLLVDTGSPGSTRKIRRFVEGLGRRCEDVHDIVLTHFDLDHVGSAGPLRARTGATVAILELDAPVVAKKQGLGRRMTLVKVAYRLLMRPLVADRLLRDGDMVGGLRVLHIPGHTDGSIALLRGDGVVFTGDAVLGDKQGNVLPPDPRVAQDLEQATASMDLVMQQHPRLLLPGHGAPARPS